MLQGDTHFANAPSSLFDLEAALRLAQLPQMQSLDYYSSAQLLVKMLLGHQALTLPTQQLQASQLAHFHQLQFSGQNLTPNLHIAGCQLPGSHLSSPTRSAASTPRSPLSDASSALSSPTTNGTFEKFSDDGSRVWCRNKKFIEPLKKGYRCTVCNKVYGRYNSVSYHVTIYHRNPPIKCDQPNCKFTTREARYIHFHRLYKHGIALPNSIDLASRKCPFFGCKHIAKSPAMLEKHMVRHVDEAVPSDGSSSRYQCQACDFRTETHSSIIAHLKQHLTPAIKVEADSEPSNVSDDSMDAIDSEQMLVKPVPVRPTSLRVNANVPINFSVQFMAGKA